MKVKNAIYPRGVNDKSLTNTTSKEKVEISSETVVKFTVFYYDFSCQI